MLLGDKKVWRKYFYGAILFWLATAYSVSLIIFWFGTLVVFSPWIAAIVGIFISFAILTAVIIKTKKIKVVEKDQRDSLKETGGQIDSESFEGKDIDRGENELAEDI